MIYPLLWQKDFTTNSNKTLQLLTLASLNSHFDNLQMRKPNAKLKHLWRDAADRICARLVSLVSFLISDVTQGVDYRSWAPPVWGRLAFLLLPFDLDVLLSLGWDLSKWIFMSCIQYDYTMYKYTLFNIQISPKLQKGPQRSKLCGPSSNFLRSNPVLPDQLAVMRCGESQLQWHAPKMVQSCKGGRWNFLKWN